MPEMIRFENNVFGPKNELKRSILTKIASMTFSAKNTEFSPKILPIKQEN